MGIEPTQGLFRPHTGFEDQERHQAPVTSALIQVVTWIRRIIRRPFSSAGHFQLSAFMAGELGISSFAACLRRRISPPA
jgi:hypothetical protein